MERCIVLVSTFITACGGGVNDIDEPLSKDYFYYGEGRDYRFIRDVHGRNNRTIYPTVIDYKYDEEFILAKQKPNFPLHRTVIASHIGDMKMRFSDREAKADSVLRNSDWYKRVFADTQNFWIILVERDSLIGPLNEDEYIVKRKELGVPDDLQLESE